MIEGHHWCLLLMPLLLLRIILLLDDFFLNLWRPLLPLLLLHQVGATASIILIVRLGETTIIIWVFHHVRGAALVCSNKCCLRRGVVDLLNSPKLEQVQFFLRFIFFHDEQKLGRLLCCQVGTQSLLALFHLRWFFEELPLLLKDSVYDSFELWFLFKDLELLLLQLRVLFRRQIQQEIYLCPLTKIKSFVELFSYSKSSRFLSSAS